MQIGEVIRKYRKLRNMTQEEMANRLGVTAPAVNKWENGNSMPDILMLAPIARLLEISLDTLLSFHDQLTSEEINYFIYQAEEELKNKTYEEAFQWAKKIIEQYANCEELIWQLAVLFDAQHIFKEVPDSEKYDDYIVNWYNYALKSESETIRKHAADALFGFYFRKEQYEKAEEYLSYYSIENHERKRKLGDIYSRTGRIEEAYKTYEELLFSEYQMVNMLLGSLYMLAMQDNNLEKAHMFVEKQQGCAKLFDMGHYHEISCALDIAMAEKDSDTIIKTMRDILASVDTITDFKKSPLYQHMEFKETREEYVSELKENLLESFRQEGFNI